MFWQNDFGQAAAPVSILKMETKYHNNTTHRYEETHGV
jgi:hypothetical protein